MRSAGFLNASHLIDSPHGEQQQECAPISSWDRVQDTLPPRGRTSTRRRLAAALSMLCLCIVAAPTRARAGLVSYTETFSNAPANATDIQVMFFGKTGDKSYLEYVTENITRSTNPAGKETSFKYLDEMDSANNGRVASGFLMNFNPLPAGGSVTINFSALNNVDHTTYQWSTGPPNNPTFGPEMNGTPTATPEPSSIVMAAIAIGAGFISWNRFNRTHKRPEQARR
jgi:hypothetical protein